jgi:hypothetical protein
VKSLLIFICTAFIVSSARAQETLPVEQKLPNKLLAVYNILKTDPNVKQGLFQIRRDKKIALVSGVYDHNKKIGTWHYFNVQGTLVQNYNYDVNRLTYEEPQAKNSKITYAFDKALKDTDLITRPIKIGGWYYGFMPYLTIFKKPTDIRDIGDNEIVATIELLISPGGHLADYSIHLVSNIYNYNQTLNVNLNLLTEEEKTFVPATLNSEPVASRMIIPCKIDGGKLYFD